MSERGVFAVDRGIWDHPSFRPQPFSDREAFIWMVGEAAYRARRVRVGAATVELERGQLSHSLRFLAAKWRWSEPAVRRFLDRLKTNAVIDADSDAGATRITICNYDRYQRVSLPIDAKLDAADDALPTQQRRKVEDKENKEIPSETSSLRVARSTRKALSDREMVIAGFQGILSPEIAAAVVEHRVKLKKPLTPHAAGLLARKFAAAPDPNSAADAMIANGWIGFDPSWIKANATNADLMRHFAGQLNRRRTFGDVVNESLAEIAAKEGARFKGPTLDLETLEISRSDEGRLL